jgi:hypothetical protein
LKGDSALKIWSSLAEILYFVEVVSVLVRWVAARWCWPVTGGHLPYDMLSVCSAKPHFHVPVSIARHEFDCSFDLKTHKNLIWYNRTVIFTRNWFWSWFDQFPNSRKLNSSRVGHWRKFTNLANDWQKQWGNTE